MVELALLMSLNSLLSGLRSQAAFQAEIIALRHQLIGPQRTQRPKRLILNRGDRCLWVWLSRFWSGWRSSLIIVKPETVVGWHRQGFRGLCNDIKWNPDAYGKELKHYRDRRKGVSTVFSFDAR